MLKSDFLKQVSGIGEIRQMPQVPKYVGYVFGHFLFFFLIFDSRFGL